MVSAAAGRRTVDLETRRQGGRQGKRGGDKETGGEEKGEIFCSKKYRSQELINNDLNQILDQFIF